jgi:hypothetical protein
MLSQQKIIKSAKSSKRKRQNSRRNWTHVECSNLHYIIHLICQLSLHLVVGQVR